MQFFQDMMHGSASCCRCSIILSSSHPCSIHPYSSSLFLPFSVLSSFCLFPSLKEIKVPYCHAEVLVCESFCPFISLTHFFRCLSAPLMFERVILSCPTFSLSAWLLRPSIGWILSGKSDVSDCLCVCCQPNCLFVTNRWIHIWFTFPLCILFECIYRYFVLIQLKCVDTNNYNCSYSYNIIIIDINICSPPILLWTDGWSANSWNG